jgi:hypothetical protein
MTENLTFQTNTTFFCQFKLEKFRIALELAYFYEIKFKNMEKLPQNVTKYKFPKMFEFL